MTVSTMENFAHFINNYHPDYEGTRTDNNVTVRVSLYGDCLFSSGSFSGMGELHPYTDQGPENSHRCYYYLSELSNTLYFVEDNYSEGTILTLVPALDMEKLFIIDSARKMLAVLDRVLPSTAGAASCETPGEATEGEADK